jgi:arylsulfatase A-like enzyme
MKKPNVVIILTDDQGYGDLSCHGHPVLKTPNLDRLHDESIRLTDFHALPMCAPTRGSLMTGQDCIRNGAMATSLGRHLPDPELTMMPELFRRSGYRTGIFGKWHLGSSYPYLPHHRGFEEAIYHLGFGLTGADDHWNNDYFNPYYRHNGELRQAEGYCTDFWFDSAMSWIDRCQADDDPFFCYIPTNVPHFPQWVDDVYKEEFAAYGSTSAGFFGMIVELDENLERFERFLAERGLRDDTIVVFMTDNGHAGGSLDIYNAGMRGGKCSRYDGGHRVPCFIRWPNGALREPGDVATPTMVQDVLPTLAELCALDPDPEARYDGTSIAPLLRGHAQTGLDERTFVVQYFQNSIEKDDAAVVRGSWRLVFGKELYDIRTDPGQETDVAERYPDLVASLKATYDRYWDELQPYVHRFHPLYVGADEEPVTTLSSCEWEDVRCDGVGSVRGAKGGPVGGPWNVMVVTPGTYTVELRRWPKESGLALDAPAPVFEAEAGTVEAGLALPIASACLEHEGEVRTLETPSGETAACFEVRLEAGRTKLHGWFRDGAGDDVCGSYYADVSLWRRD